MLVKASPPIFSAVDIFAHTSATHWACGCHLRCPFCHNWQIASYFHSPEVECIKTTGEKFYKGVKKYMNFVGLWKYVEYVHLTGGEPLITLTKDDVRAMVELAEGDGKRVSINSSLLLHPRKTDALQDAHHVAFDVKVPLPQMTGLGKESLNLLDFFVENVRKVVDWGIRTEARIPVSTATKIEEVEAVLNTIDRKFDVIVVFPLINRGANIYPRDPSWPYYKLRIPPSEEEEWKKALKPFAKEKVVVRNYFSSASG